MKPRNIFILLSVICMAFSCTTISSVLVDYDYDPEVDFTALKSYTWLPVPTKNDKYGLVVEQIKRELHTHLKDFGIEEVNSNPDFLIALHGGVQSWLDFEDWQYLHSNFETYAEKRRHDFAKHFDDSVIVDFIDLNTRTLIYRATATVNISIEASHKERQKKIKATIAKIIDNYAQLLNNES